ICSLQSSTRMVWQLAFFFRTEDQIRGPWNAYDPEADRWHPLPPIPWANSNQRHLDFSCISVAKKFLVIGGHYTPLDILGPLNKFTATNEVVQFDPFTNQWSKVAGMRVARSNLACAAVHGKVAGNLTLASAREDCVGFSCGGLFYVVAGIDNRAEQKTAEVFDPVK
ncbi:hypothetical protein KI387_023059, partial [Taxus chinensis]